MIKVDITKLILSLVGLLVPFALVAILLISSDRASAQDSAVIVDVPVANQDARKNPDGSWSVRYNGEWHRPYVGEPSKEYFHVLKVYAGTREIYCFHPRVHRTGG